MFILQCDLDEVNAPRRGLFREKKVHIKLLAARPPGVTIPNIPIELLFVMVVVTLKQKSWRSPIPRHRTVTRYIPRKERIEKNSSRMTMLVMILRKYCKQHWLLAVPILIFVIFVFYFGDVQIAQTKWRQTQGSYQRNALCIVRTVLIGLINWIAF